MSIRGLIIGFIGAILIAAGGFINDGVLYLESFTNGSQLPIIVIGLLLLTLFFLNPLLSVCNRKWCLRGSELAVIVALWSASCSIPGRGLLEQFTHSMVMPYYWELQTPAWGQYELLKYAGEGQLVTIPDRKTDVEAYNREYERVVNAYIRGSNEVGSKDLSVIESINKAIDRVPWDAWRAPLATWMPLVILSALASVCLAMITYKQWSRHEILSYPIANFTGQLLDREEGRLLPVVMHNRLFWVGFLLLLAIRINNGLVVWYPEYYIPVNLNFNMSPFSKVWPELFRVQYGASLLNIRFFPLVVAFAFFLSAEISFTLGVSQVCWVLAALPMVTIGWNLSTDWVGGWQGWQRAGAYIMMFLILVYTGRNYYFMLLLRALGLKRDGSKDENANVWAFRVLIVAFIVMVVLVCRLGLEWPFALITIFLMLLSFVVVARISAETGLFFIQPRWTIFGLLTAGFGSFAFSPTNQVICGLICVLLCIDQCHALLPYVTNGMKLCERSSVAPKKVGVATFAMYAVAVCIAVAVLLVAVYEWGVPQRMHWSYQRLPTMTFRTALPEINQLKAIGSLEEAETLGWIDRISRIAPREHFVFAFLFGMVAVALFSFLRLRLPKWPLHPVMFLLWATFPMEQTCHAFFFGWLLKKGCIRFGGVQMVKALQPLMVGVIAGELLAAVVFMIVGAIYYWYTGEVPKVYRWFPR